MSIHTWKVVAVTGGYDMVKPNGSTRGRPYPKIELAQKAMGTSVKLTLSKWRQNGWAVGETQWADMSITVEANPPDDRLMPVQVHLPQSQHARAVEVAAETGTTFSALMREALDVVIHDSGQFPL